MVNESATEMVIVTLMQNEILHWILMEILIWTAGPHHQTLHLTLPPAKKYKSVSHTSTHLESDSGILKITATNTHVNRYKY
jgi:hypothetical protein